MSENSIDNTKIDWKYYRVAQGLLVHNEQVLLVGNDYGHKDLTWSLPGGRLEPGESHIAAVQREVLEETGLEVIAGDMLYVVDSRTQLERKHFVALIFSVSLLNPNLEPNLVCEVNGPVKEVRFVPFADIPNYITRPSVGEGLLNYLYFGANSSRYWVYPDYLTSEWKPVQWPPQKREAIYG